MHISSKNLLFVQPGLIDRVSSEYPVVHVCQCHGEGGKGEGLSQVPEFRQLDVEILQPAQGDVQFEV